MVDSRPISARRKAPIDRISEAWLRDTWKFPQYQTKKRKVRITDVVKPKKPLLFGRKAYTKTQIEDIARSGKVPKGNLMKYDHFYLPDMDLNKKYPLLKEEDIEDEIPEEDEVYQDEAIDENKVRTFRTQQYPTVSQALKEPPPEPLYYKGTEGPAKARFIDRIFYFTEGEESIPIE